jgi:hypothetical protein
MAIGQEDKGFQPFNWWRGKVCPLDLHVRCQWPKGNGLQNTYIAEIFVSFGARKLYSGGKFIQNKNGNPNSPQEVYFFFLN